MAEFLKIIVFSVHTRADTYMKSQRLWQHARDLHKLKPKKSQHGGGEVGMKSHP